MYAQYPFIRASDIRPAQYEGNEWLVHGLIPIDGVVVLASAPKTGKTCFATALARAVATGQDFLGKPVKQGPVLWCSHEETYRERLLLHEGLTDQDPFFVGYPSELPALDTPEQKTDRFGRRNYENQDPPYVFNQATALGASLIVIDCLHAAVERGNLAENQWARFVMGRLRNWSFRFHVSVLVLHHLTKSATRGHHPERFADSAQILAAASCHFFMERHQETETRSRVVFHGRGRHPAPYSRLELLSDGVLDYRLADPAEPPTKPQTLSDRILSLLEDGWGLTSPEIATRLGAGAAQVRHVLRDLTSQGAVCAEPKDRKTLRYCLNEGEV